MLNRQRSLLALLSYAQSTGHPGLTKIQLTKFSFFIRNALGAVPGVTYEFVPYKYGPFSFALYRDLGALVDQGYVHQRPDASQRLTVNGSSLGQVQTEASKLPRKAWPGVREVVDEFATLGHDELLSSVYSRFPWYAQNTERHDLVHKVVEPTPPAEPAAYTVGYEGKCIDGFLAGILRSGVRRIVDVRRNPISRKYGFAKSTLSRHLTYLGIGYLHMPELGIASEERADLSDASSYRALLDRYERVHLPANAFAVDQVTELLHEKSSALLCMERDASMCHRSRLARRAGEVGCLDVHHLS